MAIKVEKDLILVFEWYVDDGWYGKRYRYALSKEKGIGFSKQSEAKEYKKDFLNFLKYYYNNDMGKITASKFKIGERSSYETYRYCSFGPSYSCTQYDVTVQELIDLKNK